MSTLGYIILFIGGLFIGLADWQTWKQIVAAVILSAFCLLNFPSNSFTGDPDKDAKIMNERVMKDGDDPNEVMNELINFYIEEGYGMQRAKDALNRVGNY